jgi:hypothetical protein
MGHTLGEINWSSMFMPAAPLRMKPFGDEHGVDAVAVSSVGISLTESHGELPL